MSNHISETHDVGAIKLTVLYTWLEQPQEPPPNEATWGPEVDYVAVGVTLHAADAEGELLALKDWMPPGGLTGFVPTPAPPNRPGVRLMQQFTAPSARVAEEDARAAVLAVIATLQAQRGTRQTRLAQRQAAREAAGRPSWIQREPPGGQP